jgi:hypothetical protein
MDISGEQQMDISHDIVKTRISKDGQLVEKIKGNSAFYSPSRLRIFPSRNQPHRQPWNTLLIPP